MNTTYLRYAIVGAVCGGMAVSLLLAQAQPAEKPAPQPIDPNRVVITLPNQQLTASDFQAFVSMLPPDAQALMQTAAGRRAIADELIRLKLLAAEAQNQKLDQNPRFAQQLAMMRDQMLMGMLLQSLEGKLVTDEEIARYYEENRKELEQVTARHILAAGADPRDEALTEAQRKARDEQARRRIESIAKRLTGGESFEEIAKEESDDPGSKETGGALDPFVRGMMVPEFEQVAFSLEPGKLSEPVKTAYGYHLIIVEKREVPPLEKIEDAIGDQLRNEKLQQMVESMRKKADPKLDETFFGPPPKAPAGAPAN